MPASFNWKRTIRSAWSSAKTGLSRCLVVGPTGSFARQMPRRMRIKLYTGVGVKEGQADPHWQLVAVSNEPHFKPRPALVTPIPSDWRMANNPDRSQWISAVGDWSCVPNGVTYTFRTTFQLADVVRGSTILRGWFIAVNHVTAIRLNGKAALVPEHGYDPPYEQYHKFTIANGAVEGANSLEIDVFNGLPGAASYSRSAVAVLVELEGSAATLPKTSQTGDRKERD